MPVWHYKQDSYHKKSPWRGEDPALPGPWSVLWWHLHSPTSKGCGAPNSVPPRLRVPVSLNTGRCWDTSEILPPQLLLQVTLWWQVGIIHHGRGWRGAAGGRRRERRVLPVSGKWWKASGRRRSLATGAAAVLKGDQGFWEVYSNLALSGKI